MKERKKRRERKKKRSRAEIWMTTETMKENKIPTSSLPLRLRVSQRTNLSSNSEFRNSQRKKRVSALSQSKQTN
jgi:hypothetical protein